MISTAFLLFRTTGGVIAIIDGVYGKLKKDDIVTDGETTIKIKTVLQPSLKLAEEGKEQAIVEVVK